MIDYQFLGLAAVVFAVMTRGSVLPVLAMTALVAFVLASHEAALRRYRRRRPHPAAADAASDPSDTELTRWMTVMDRVLKSPD
jgi:hypothetical protein